jgi:phytoene dehydrogenase-like protein
MTPFDVSVVGGGANALVTATLMARAGLKTVVLERTDRAGGCARTSEIAPGFRCPTLSHVAAIDPVLVRTLRLEQHGLRIARPSVDACAPTLTDRPLVLWRDCARAAASIAVHSATDAERYPRFLDSFARIATVLRELARTTPPDIDAPAAADLLGLLTTGRRFRALGKPDAYRLLRYLPMPVADLAGEWFESEPLKATIAAGGVLGSPLGPWSAGSTALLLLLGAGEAAPVANGWFAHGGPGVVADALAAAARQSGVEIRTDAEVAQIEVRDGAATGVMLASGESIPSRAVVSGADPRRTLLGLVDPIHLEPDTIQRLRHVRMRGMLAKINFAVNAVPRFSSLASMHAEEQREALSGRVRIAATIAAIERAFDAAKYGGFAEEPWIELTIPSILDPSLAPPDRHVVSAYVQYAPYQLRGTTWDTERDRLGAAATATIDRYAPGFASSVIARDVITPLDLERVYGLTGGHIFHGELALDQFFVTRPLLGWARYATPIRHLFLCGSGTHPGTGLDGRSGANAAREILRRLKA